MRFANQLTRIDTDLGRVCSLSAATARTEAADHWINPAGCAVAGAVNPKSALACWKPGEVLCSDSHCGDMVQWYESCFCELHVRVECLLGTADFSMFKKQKKPCSKVCLTYKPGEDKFHP